VSARRVLRGLVWALVAAGSAIVGSFLWFVATIPDASPAPAEQADAIVVLTGGADRLRAGLALLDSQSGRKLFISGVNPSVDMDKLLAGADVPAKTAACCVILGHQAGDTQGNALETSRWMRNEGYSSLRLVTASYHMRRSLLEFRRAMPAVVVTPHPVIPEPVRGKNWWLRRSSLRLVAIEYVKYVLAVVRPVVGEQRADAA
jgi:uncharacterized SAM-binding protein YcdF (DUF218 family)